MVFLEVWMREYLAVLLTVQLVEVVQIEESDKGMQIGPFEVLGEDLIAEGGLVVDNEFIKSWTLPRDNGISLVIVDHLI